MLTISKPLSASQARNYHAKEFASQQQNYWSRDQQGHSEWQGKLAGAVESYGTGSRRTLRSTSRGPASPNRRTTRPASGFADVRGQERKRSNERRTSRRVGRHVFRTEVGFDHGACGRRRPGTAGAPGERPRGAIGARTVTRRPASETSMRRRRQASSLPPLSSMTRPAPSMAMRRRNYTPMP